MAALGDPTNPVPPKGPIQATFTCYSPLGEAQPWFNKGTITVEKAIPYDAGDLENLIGRVGASSGWDHSWNPEVEERGRKFIIRPTKIYRDPKGRPDHIYIVGVCDAIDGVPFPSNNRDAAETTLNHPGVAAEEPRVQMRVHLMFMRADCSGPLGTHCWAFRHVTPDDDLVLKVIQEISEDCERAGIQGGISTLVDDVWTVRYIGEMVAKRHGLVVFDPNMIPGYYPEAGIHMMFSTKSMRKASGYEAADIAVKKLEMKAALSGERGSEFKIIPYYDAPIEDGGKVNGYVIDVKMPPSHEMMDPYMITSWVAETVLLWKPTFRENLDANSHTNSFLRALRSAWNKLKRFVTRTSSWRASSSEVLG